MQVNLSLHLSSNKYKCLCFTHAVQEAMKGKEIFADVDDYSNDYCMISTICRKCSAMDFPFEQLRRTGKQDVLKMQYPFEIESYDKETQNDRED